MSGLVRSLMRRLRHTLAREADKYNARVLADLGIER
jgi:hypothetical protein